MQFQASSLSPCHTDQALGRTTEVTTMSVDHHSERKLAAIENARLATRTGDEHAIIDALLELASSWLFDARRHRLSSTLLALRAVIDQLENPNKFRRDQGYWEAHGATRRKFKRWSCAIHAQLTEVVDDTEFSAPYEAQLLEAGF